MRRRNALALALATLALAALGCEKKNPSGSSSGAEIADFPDAKASSWVNGAPALLAQARGKVVLVEAWHPT